MLKEGEPLNLQICSLTCNLFLLATVAMFLDLRRKEKIYFLSEVDKALERKNK